VQISDPARDGVADVAQERFNPDVRTDVDNQNAVRRRTAKMFTGPRSVL
jgi:hypothetical protein